MAVIVAIEDYLSLPDVPGAKANALAWEAYLRVRGVPVVKMLLDADAAAAKVPALVPPVARQRKPVGRVWVVFIRPRQQPSDVHQRRSRLSARALES